VERLIWSLSDRLLVTEAKDDGSQSKSVLICKAREAVKEDRTDPIDRKEIPIQKQAHKAKRAACA
jgi:hypothetical protein